MVFKLGGFSASGKNIYASVLKNDGWDCGIPLAANVERMPATQMNGTPLRSPGCGGTCTHHLTLN